MGLNNESEDWMTTNFINNNSLPTSMKCTKNLQYLPNIFTNINSKGL